MTNEATESPGAVPGSAPLDGGVRPRAWCVPRVGGDYLRSHPSLPNNGDPPMAWEPLYDSAALEAVRAAERERCAKLCEGNSAKWDAIGGDGGASLECADLIRGA